MLDYDQLDPGIRDLVRALNTFPGIETVSSCEGHQDGFSCGVYFVANNLDDLPLVLYWFDSCHSGENWIVVAGTDCTADHVTLHAYPHPDIADPAASSQRIAAAMMEREDG